MSRRAAGRPAGPARSGPGASRGSRPAPAARRGSTRPARRRSTLSTSDAADAAGVGADRRPPGGLTGRAAVLGLVVCALVLSLAYPAKEFLAQRGEIGRLQQEQRETQARVTSLEERKRQLADPTYVRAQARARLNFVLPGETVYVVVPASGSAAGDAARPDVPVTTDDDPWYGRLWGTVRTADGSAP